MKLLFLVISIAITCSHLNAMKRPGDDLVEQPATKRLSLNTKLFSLPYPWSNNPSHLDRVCYRYARWMKDEHDTQVFAALPDRFVRRIITMYHIENMTPKATLSDIVEFDLLSEEFIDQPVLANYLAKVFNGSINAADIEDNVFILTSYPSLVEYSRHVHRQIYDYCRALSPFQIEVRYDFLNKQSTDQLTLKMALRFAYVRKNNTNLDDLDCASFVSLNDRFGVNEDMLKHTTKLYSDENLHSTLSLLESLMNEPVTKLALNNSKLTDLPATIGHLVNLEKLNLADNKLISLPNALCNLVNLKYLDLSNNKLSDEALEKVCKLVPATCTIIT